MMLLVKAMTSIQCFKVSLQRPALSGVCNFTSLCVLNVLHASTYFIDRRKNPSKKSEGKTCHYDLPFQAFIIIHGMQENY